MNIALCVTGSISAYKAFDLTRLLIKAGHRVRVVLSSGALKFIRPETFSYLGAEAVYQPQDDFTAQDIEAGEGPVLHINLIKWADKMVIAPLSANTLADLAAGKAQGLIASMFLAWDFEKPILLFPAMNTKMLNHPFTQENLKKLSGLSCVFEGPTASGELACGDVGEGKLLEVEKMAALIKSVSLKDKKKTLLLTAGATLAPLDSVRYLTNPSTGKTAIPFIEKSLSDGLTVIVIAGQYATEELDAYKTHPRFSLQRVITTEDMKNAVHKEFPHCDYYISTAAIGDIQFKTLEGEDFKLKKSSLNGHLDIEKSADILKSVLEMKKPHQKIVGFAAETKLTDEVLQEKMNRKPVDFLVGTQVTSGLVKSGATAGFGTNKATYRFSDNGVLSDLLTMSKSEMATAVLNKLY